MNADDASRITQIALMAAMADGQISPEEQRELASVASRLGVPAATTAIDQPAAARQGIGVLAASLTASTMSSTASPARTSGANQRRTWVRIGASWRASAGQLVEVRVGVVDRAEVDDGGVGHLAHRLAGQVVALLEGRHHAPSSSRRRALMATLPRCTSRLRCSAMASATGTGSSPRSGSP